MAFVANGLKNEAVADLSKLPGHTLWLDCDVLQADGGTRTASITGAWLAAEIAIRRAIREGSLETSPFVDSVAAVSVGIVDASEHADYPVGTKVFCAGGWRTHTIQNGKGFIGKIPDAVPLPLSLWIGVLGVPGLTAWFGLKAVAKFSKGDRVLVTSAAGPVGARSRRSC